MTDVTSLQTLAQKISSQSQNIKNYCIAQAKATISQELDIVKLKNKVAVLETDFAVLEDDVINLRKDVEVLKLKGQGTIPTTPPPVGGSGVGYTVNPKGVATTVYVDFGTDFKTFSNTTAGVAIGAGSADVTGSIGLPALSPNTMYFYRVRAVNAQGESVSATKWFLTPAVGGTTRHVGSGQTHANINAALSAAVAGDTIMVHAGTYSGFTLTKAVASLIRILKQPGDAVDIDNIQFNGASHIYFGPGFRITGASYAPSSGNHLIDLTNSQWIYLDGVQSAYAGAATGDCSPFWAYGGGTQNFFCLGCTFTGGGVCKSYDGVGVGGGGAGQPGNWPGPARFLSCVMAGQSADIYHCDGYEDHVFESCLFRDPNPVPIPSEHHDGIQAVYGDGMIIRRCIFSWAGATLNGNNQAIIMGDFAGQDAKNLNVENILVRGWNGCGVNSQGAGLVVRNVTQWNTRGVNGGQPDSNVQHEDFIIGAPGDNVDLANTIAWRHFDNGSGTHTGHHNHVTSGPIGISGLTNTSVGVPQFINPADNGDFHPVLGGNLDRTGGNDGNTPKWDLDGRGYGPVMSKGCYAPTNVTTPLVGQAPTYTP